MTDEVKTFRNISGHPEDLEDGSVVATGGFVDLSAKAIKANKAKLEENFLEVPQQQQDPEPFDREAALARAKEFEIKNASRMRNDELQTAINAAEEEEANS